MKENVEETIINPNEEVVLYQWESAERPYKTRDRDFWITIVAILFIVGIIFFMIKEFFLVLAIASGIFFFYVLSTVPPGRVINKLTNRGVYFGEVRSEWTDLEKFWFKPMLDSDMVHFGTNLKFPRLISIVVNQKDIEKIKEIAVKYIPLLESSPSFTDKLTTWVIDHLPLEKRSKEKQS